MFSAIGEFLFLFGVGHSLQIYIGGNLGNKTQILLKMCDFKFMNLNDIYIPF